MLKFINYEKRALYESYVGVSIHSKKNLFISDNTKNRDGTEFIQTTREPFLIKHLKLKSGVYRTMTLNTSNVVFLLIEKAHVF